MLDAVADRALSLAQADPEIHEILETERARQAEQLNLIASENTASRAVLEATGSFLTNKYAEGYPGARWYRGCEVVDRAETAGIERAKRLFGAEHANLQPHSGTQANLAVYTALMEPGDTLLSLELAHGGHLSHGSKMSQSGALYRVVHYGLDPKTERIDLDSVREAARREKPKVILSGFSAYPREIDFAAFGGIAREVGARLVVDMAHIAGLVAAGVHPNPVPHADAVTTTTHKTLRGPRGGMILCRKEHAKAIDRAVFPMLQGGPLMHVVAAKAVALGEALSDSFRAYQRRVVENARALADGLAKVGLRLVAGGTDNHLILADVRPLDLDGETASRLLEEAAIVVNRNAIPFDPLPPKKGSGIRLGTPTVTSRGMGTDEMARIAAWTGAVLHAPGDAGLRTRIREEIRTFCRDFPLGVEAPLPRAAGSATTA